MRDINLNATEYFEAVARLGTVTKAAAGDLLGDMPEHSEPDVVSQ